MDVPPPVGFTSVTFRLDALNLSPPVAQWVYAMVRDRLIEVSLKT
jgi:hypothetical protein